MLGGITGLLGSAYGSKSELYGKRPDVPDQIDYEKALSESVATNKRLLPDLAELAKLSTEEFANVLEKAMPGYKNLRDSGTSQIASMVRGEIPADVENLLERQAAERGISLGYAGSQFGTNQLVRNLGLTSLDLVQRGLDSASRWISQAQNVTFDFSKSFLSKEDAIRKTEFNWNRDWLSAQVKAAPDPAVRGAFDSEMAFLGMVLSVYGGGAGYTGQYRNTGYGTSGGGGGGGGADGNQSFFGFGSPDPQRSMDYNIGTSGGYSGE